MPASMPDQFSRNFAPRRISARDRRLAAIHEAGHVAIAQRQGVTVRGAGIWPTGSDCKLEKTWVGQTGFFGKINAAKGRLIAVAGAVAEHCWNFRRYHQLERDQLLEDWFWEDPAMMSESDWHFGRIEPGEPDHLFMRAVERVYADFEPATGKLWPEVCNVARGLIVDARDWNEEAA